jgi:hypothetical protein
MVAYAPPGERAPRASLTTEGATITPSASTPDSIEITTADYRWFVDQALDEMVAIVTGLGDELANRRPGLAGANSPYVILAHCLGVMESWGGASIAGRPIARDRDAELASAGPVAELCARVDVSRVRFAEDLSALDAAAHPRADVDPEDADRPYGRSQAGVLFHVYEELSQHLGQMELTRDLLMAGG